MTPGWTQLAVTPVPASRRASSYVKSTLANFDCAYAVSGAYRRWACRSSKSIAPLRSTCDATVTTRAGALATSRSRKRFVSRNGAR